MANSGFTSPGTIRLRYVPAVDVLERRVAPEAIAGKLVLIGTSAIGLLDAKTTPIDPLLPGVEVHAQVLESALTRSVLSSPNYAIGAELCAALADRRRYHLARAHSERLGSPGLRRD